MSVQGRTNTDDVIKDVHYSIWIIMHACRRHNDPNKVRRGSLSVSASEGLRGYFSCLIAMLCNLGCIRKNKLKSYISKKA